MAIIHIRTPRWRPDGLGPRKVFLQNHKKGLDKRAEGVVK